MFTGIIQSLGELVTREVRGCDQRLTIRSAGMDFSTKAPGDSIAVNGVCLTAIELKTDAFVADVSIETLDCTTLGQIDIGDPVNLESALTLGSPLGGHLVSGHVDGVGRVVSRGADGHSQRFRFTAPGDIARFVAAKGSICVDGVSLTVNIVDGCDFEVNIVPHTLEHTTFDRLGPGTQVNLEIDLIARYVERMNTFGRDHSSITTEVP